MTMLRKVLFCWGKTGNHASRASRYLLIIAKAIKAPVFPVVFELQLEFVAAAFEILREFPPEDGKKKPDTRICLGII